MARPLHVAPGGRGDKTRRVPTKEGGYDMGLALKILYNILASYMGWPLLPIP